MSKSTRRAFLKGAAALSVAASVPTLADTDSIEHPHLDDEPTQCGFGLAPIKAEGQNVAYDPASEYRVISRTIRVPGFRLWQLGSDHEYHHYIAGEPISWEKAAQTHWRWWHTVAYDGLTQTVQPLHKFYPNAGCDKGRPIDLVEEAAHTLTGRPPRIAGGH